MFRYVPALVSYLQKTSAFRELDVIWYMHAFA